jgi:hypothetical protein
MKIPRDRNRSLTFALTLVALGSFSVASHGQTPAERPPGPIKVLMQEPLGDTADPHMSLFILNISAGVDYPKAQTHRRSLRVCLAREHRESVRA